MSDAGPTELMARERPELPVELPAFTGPLDLLLHLIQKNKMSIYDIPIASICNQYHEHLQTMQELDLEVAGEFLWMASWLVQLKSRTLLPRVTEEEDPRAELVERLLEYRRVKELAALLWDQDVVRRCVWPAQASPATVEPAGEPELDWEEVDIRTLARAYLEAMDHFAATHPPPLAILPLRYTVETTMRDLYGEVLREGLVPLLRHLHTRSDPEEVVTLVVATLELARLGGIRAEQRRRFAEIYLRPGPARLEVERMFTGEAGDGA